MALHFSREEFDERKTRVLAEMAERKLDAMLIFAPESMYWLTGYDTFGFCFFQCLVLTADGRYVLVTRLPDLRQARHTSLVEDIRIWTDRGGSDPLKPLQDILFELDLLGARIGIETDTQGLTAKYGRLLDESLEKFAKTIVDVSDLIQAFRMVKSAAEIQFVREAARLTEAAWNAGRAEIAPGADEGQILAAMQGAILAGGGDYPGNEFVIGSGHDALLCRYKSGRRRLDPQDQLTLEFAGVYRHYHAAMMETAVIGAPTERHEQLFAAATEALAAVIAAIRPGKTFGDVFDAHARVIDEHGLHDHRLNACGYSLGARFSPSWMDAPMFYRDKDTEIVPDMVLFAHIILMDSDTGTAMTRGRTFLTTGGDPEPLLDVSDAMVVIG